MRNIIILAFLFFFSLPASAEEAPRLHVQGNWLTTPNGEPVTLRGVSLCSISYNDPQKLLETLAQQKDGWSVDVVRLPVQPSEWDRLGPDQFIHDNLDPAVRQCRIAGLYCVIDWHEVADWQSETITARLNSFWGKVAPRYKNDPFILYEVFNEPRNPADDTLENWRAYRSRAQLWVDEIRSDAPDTVLLVGSPRWSQLAGFAAIEPLRGNNLVYTYHLYHGSPRADWDRLFGHASEKIPLFISEWGWSSLIRNRLTPFYGTLSGFANPVKAYLDLHPQISWTAWSYDPACGPAMTGKDQEMAEFVRSWLKQHRTTSSPSDVRQIPGGKNTSASSQGRG